MSLFPFLLKLIDPYNVDRLSHVLDMMESPDLLWTEYGLRSIAKTDKFYRKMNAANDEPYWRGPIWININYLALAALSHYKEFPLKRGGGGGDQTVSKQVEKQQVRVKALYNKLKTAVQRTILGEYVRTGYFWEQYDDLSGRGMRGHPFTGWTALVVNIMAEKY
jgi:mannosyl-oligosaccharide glucosidase